MNVDKEEAQIRKLRKEEKLPYDLLLLADEAEAICRYIYDSDIYVLELKDKVLAVYVLHTLDDDTAEIKNIAVLEEFQGQGIGKVLLKHAIDKVKERGLKSIIIGTGDVSVKQLHLYQKAGFEKCGIKENFFLENYPEPVYENGLQLKHMIMLEKKVNS